MGTVVENITLDDTNEDFFNASELVRFGHKLIYLTGKAGTGKTTFLKYIREASGKKTIVVAPTGVAAINAGGQTIHSFFKVKPSLYVPNDKRLRAKADQGDEDRSTIYDHFKFFSSQVNLIKEMELLIIDEISMVRCDLLDVIDRVLRVYRKQVFEPFGGVQVLLIGDTFQLPPIAEFEQWEILKQFYESPYFFSAKVIKQNKPLYIELKKIYRQSDQDFIDLLNRIRVNQVADSELRLLNSKVNTTFVPEKDSKYIILATHNRIVDTTNITKLEELTTPLKTFEARVTGVFPDNQFPTDKMLSIKVGAQVMFIKNDTGKYDIDEESGERTVRQNRRRYYNGKIARIKAIDEKGITVALSDTEQMILEKETWKNVRFKWNDEFGRVEEEEIGTFTQYPIKLAWAITVHKSQGLTFENVIADLGAAFAPGQVYVALSRCTSFNGLVLKTRIDNGAIKTDPEVIRFATNETPSTLIVQELNSGKADFYYRQAREALNNRDLNSSIDSFFKALKYRDDTNKEVIQRWIKIYVSKKLISSEVAENLSTSLDSANSKLARARTDNDELSNMIASLRAKIADRDKKITTSETNNEVLSNTIASLKLQIASNDKLLSEHKDKLSAAERRSTLFEQEVNRLNNLKWYQKLFSN